MRTGERQARHIILNLNQWKSLGEWHFEFPLSISHSGTGAPRRMDAICPTVQLFAEVKTCQDEYAKGEYQADHNAHLLWNARNIGGSWIGVVTDGTDRARMRRYYLGTPISEWEDVTPHQIVGLVALPHNLPDAAFGWMSQGLRLIWKNGQQHIICRQCEEPKPAYLFYKNVRNKYQRNDLCRVCDNRERVRRYRNAKERTNDSR